jgi:hypothetical protein
MPRGVVFEADACSDTSRIVRTQAMNGTWWSLDGVDLIESVLQVARPAVAGGAAEAESSRVFAVCLDEWGLYLGKWNKSIQAWVALRVEERPADRGAPVATWLVRSRTVYSWEERASLEGAGPVESHIWRVLCIATADALRFWPGPASSPSGGG